MRNEKQIEVMAGIQLVTALKEKAIKTGAPASFLVRATSNLSEYFAKNDLDKCLEIIGEVAAQ